MKVRGLEDIRGGNMLSGTPIARPHHMARPLWKGTISFGLVSIPIQLHTAVRDHRPRFRMLHAKDTSPIKFARVCVRDGHEVAWDDLVKGYEYTKGRFVVLTKEDFEAAAVEKTKRVDIIDFVDASEIDDRYFETPYYVAPTTGGDHSYALLREAMRQENKVGIAKFILRETQHLAALEVIDDALVLSTMRFADELAEPDDLGIPGKTEMRKNELDLARALVNNLSATWDPSKYTDEYRDNLMKVIAAKAKGAHITLTAKPEHHDAKVVNLMERLRESLQSRTSTPAQKASPARKVKPTRVKKAARKTAGTRRRSAGSGRSHAA